jgi:hypothetical protein
MIERFKHDKYIIRRKFWQILGATVFVETAEGQPVMNAKLKAFKLREDIRLYSDEARTDEILRIGARTIIDLGITYDVFDSKTNEKIGSVKRKGWKSILQDEWEIWDANEQVIGTVKEDSMTMALLRRFLTNLIPQNFHMRDTKGDSIGTVHQNFNPFTVKLNAQFQESNVDRRLAVVAVVMLAAIEGRQG